MFFRCKELTDNKPISPRPLSLHKLLKNPSLFLDSMIAQQMANNMVSQQMRGLDLGKALAPSVNYKITHHHVNEMNRNDQKNIQEYIKYINFYLNLCQIKNSAENLSAELNNHLDLDDGKLVIKKILVENLLDDTLPNNISALVEEALNKIKKLQNFYSENLAVHYLESLKKSSHYTCPTPLKEFIPAALRDLPSPLKEIHENTENVVEKNMILQFTEISQLQIKAEEREFNERAQEASVIKPRSSF